MIVSYLLIIVGVVAWVALIPGRKKVSPNLMTYITVFGGGFLLASCFINLVPHMFLGEGEERFVTSGIHFKIAASVMIGFLIQLLLEQLTHGAEHGHNHCHHCEEEHHIHPITGLMIGLCIHAFLEGMPMIEIEGDGEIDIHQGLLYGIVLHNIPIAIVMVTLFISNGYGFLKSLVLLMIFAIMTPLGSLTNLYLIPGNETLQCIIMGIVVGILLHVSVSILFDHDHNNFSWSKLITIILAFVAAYFTPGCPEIYPML
jgi:zinc transporter ZupT